MIDMAPITDSVRSDLSRNRELSAANMNGGGGPAFHDTLQNTLSTMERRDIQGTPQQRLMNVCIEMESIFVGRMLREMRNTVNKSDWLHGGFAEDVFTDMLYDEYALQVSRNSNLGLARQLYTEMSRNLAP